MSEVDTTHTDRRTGAMFAALRVRNYRLFASGQVVSLVGTWMQRVAQDWLVLELSGGSPVALGVAAALQFGPTLLLSLWGGAIADRYDKRRLLMGLQVGMGACALVLGAARRRRPGDAHPGLRAVRAPRLHLRARRPRCASRSPARWSGRARSPTPSP